MTYLKNFSSRFLTAAVFVSLLFVSACREDDPNPSNNPNLKVNNWIQENMDFWYLWNTQLPASPDKTLAPDAFFESLLVEEDRFSWIQDNYQELINSLQGITKEGGYEFTLYLESPGSTNVIAQIVYVKPSSPASAAGLKRGDYITHINDQQLTTSNYQALLGAISENHTLRVKAYDVEAQTFGSPTTVSINAVEYSENPNFLSKVITVGDHKIGYYVYNFFANGTTASPSQYKAGMQQIFANFKSQGITDLILDLRFNGGGTESSAMTLASLIGKGVDNTKIFARREYNDDVEAAIISDPELGPSFLNTMFANEGSNVGSMLNNSRVYILTSSRTASASELVINALKPFMDVFLIGETTYGKNVGSISLQDEENKENDWGMQPIVVKIYNSLNQSDYSTGFVPNIVNEDNSLFLYPLGDERETLLSAAIGHITGTSSSGRGGVKSPQHRVGYSLDLQRRGRSLIIDQNIPKL